MESGNPVYDSRDNCNAIIETSSNTLIVGCKGSTIPNSVISIGDNAFYQCASLTAISIPNSVTSIGGAAFGYCSSLTSVTIPNSVTSIGSSAFSYCTGLTSVTIPNSVTSIGSSAFSYCTGLTSVTIPNSVTSIGGFAFSDCTSLARILSYPAPNMVTLGRSVFDNVPKSTCVLHVLDNYLDSYQSADQWKDFSSIMGDLGKSGNGDVNSDNAVDITDVVGIANHVMGGAPNNFAIISADVNGDGAIDITDVVKLANTVMGI